MVDWHTPIIFTWLSYFIGLLSGIRMLRSG